MNRQQIHFDNVNLEKNASACITLDVLFQTVTNALGDLENDILCVDLLHVEVFFADDVCLEFHYDEITHWSRSLRRGFIELISDEQLYDRLDLIPF